MAFDCPYYLENYCELQKGPCHPAKGKCILKGKLHVAPKPQTNSKKENE